MSVRPGRVYDPPQETDGIRVLVDRLWPLGMSKTRAALDEWCKQVAVLTDLLGSRGTGGVTSPRG